MTKLWLKSVAVLTLATLWLTCVPDSARGQDEVTVPTSLLRQATARIDSLELQIMLIQNRAVERDSLYASERRYWMTRIAEANADADLWYRRSQSWWGRHESAFWVAIGAIAVALATH